MWKQLTGEPVAGELHSGFGGRGRLSSFPTPIQLELDNLIDVKLCVNRPNGREFRGEKSFRIILSLSFSTS